MLFRSYNDVGGVTFFNQNGVVESVTLQRLIIHEATHALSDLTVTDDDAGVLPLNTDDPHFQGSTVLSTNVVLNALGVTTNRMNYLELRDTSGNPHVYGDNGESFEVGTSLTNGEQVDHVYFSADIVNNNGDNSFGGTSGVDLLLGMWGDDIFYMSRGEDWVYGGTGTDTISYSLPGQTDLPDGVEMLILELGAITLLSGGFGVQDNFFSIERIIGTTVDDTFSYLDDLSVFPLTEIDGSDGIDTFDLSGRTEAAVFTIGSGTGEVNLSSFERIILTGLDDELTLASLDDLSGFNLSGDSIPVVLDGGAGTDILRITGPITE